MSLVQVTTLPGPSRKVEVLGTEAIRGLNLGAKQWTSIFTYGMTLARNAERTDQVECPPEVEGLDYTRILHALSK